MVQNVKFGDVVRNITDRVDEPSKAGVDRYVGLEHLDPGVVRISRWGSPHDVDATKLRFKPGDVIFGKRRAYQRKLASADFAGICSAHAMVLRADERYLLSTFLPYFMSTDEFWERAISISVGSLSPTINWKDLADQEFTLPTIEEQKRVVKVLALVDGLDSQYASLAKSIDQALSATRNDFLAAVGSKSTIGEQFTVELGKTISKSAREGPRKKPYLANKDVQWDTVHVGDLKEMHFDPSEDERFQVKPGDLLVCEGGEVGRAAIWNGAGGVHYQNSIHRLRPKPDALISVQFALEFFYWAARSGKLLPLTGKSTIAHISKKRLMSLSIPILPQPKQEKLVQVCAEARRLMRSVESRRDSLRALRSPVVSEVESVSWDSSH